MSKTILLTGTSQGIGNALTKLLLINGYRVIGTNTLFKLLRQLFKQNFFF